MNVPAIQEGGCTQLPRLPGHDERPDIGVIPISGSALLSSVTILAGILGVTLRFVDPGGRAGAIISVVGLAMGIAGLIKSGPRWEKILGAVGCLTAIAALGVAILT